MSPWTIVGIDPAPSKPTVACINNRTFHSITPTKLPRFVAELIATHPRLLIA